MLNSTSSWFEEQGIRIRREWISECCSGISLSSDVQLPYVISQFLMEDLYHSSLPVLPQNIHSFDRQKLLGNYTLQIIEIANIGEALEKRSEETPHRMLKLCLTDGHQQVIGIEYNRISELSISSPSGTKIVVRDVDIHQGVWLLTDENCVVLGGGTAEEEELVPVEEESMDVEIQHLFEDSQPIIEENAISFTYLFEISPVLDQLKLHGGSLVPRTKYLLQGWIKTAVGFNCASGTYDLQVIIEDGSQSVQVDVDPSLIENLLGGIPCREFLVEYRSKTEKARELARRLEWALQSFEGTMTIAVGGSEKKHPILMELSRETDRAIKYFLNKVS